MSATTAKYRADYRPLDFKIPNTELLVQLDVPFTRVSSKLEFARTNAQATTFKLDGQKLNLESLKIDGQDYPHYTLTNHPGKEGFQTLELDVSHLANPDHFTLEIVNTFNLEENKSLMGIYKSGNLVCSQCEAEGFRQITFYFDRPDNLSVFRVRIEADKSLKYLLSNGNPQGEGELPNGRHYAEWHDPFPKPSYLFALCAGDFDVIEDYFVTMSGRKVTLRLFSEQGKKDGMYFAMDSLKRAMKWDEERFGLEYDLDLFMIVAVSFFNMGAMENKGLNVFNEICLIGNKDYSTDSALIHSIDRVVAHEYFHNWTGDRVTCRDWFQLTLKEGLTVFRDQEYTCDHYDRTNKRIEDVEIVKRAQFPQDAGPMAHPIRPEKVLSQDNFYTVTVYEKGAEVIRMIHTLLGEEKFQAGMRLYFQRHDGDAVTCDDFVAAMQDASGIDLTSFKRWYSQSGTPRVTVTTDYDAASKTYRVNFEQVTLPTNDQAVKEPLFLILKTEFIDRTTGAVLTGLKDVNGVEVPELITFDTVNHQVEIQGLDAEPLLVTNLDFSSPIIVNKDYTFDELVFIAKNTHSLYARSYAYRTMLERLFATNLERYLAGQELEFSPQLLDLYDFILDNALAEPSFTANLLRLDFSLQLIPDATNLDPVALRAVYRQTMAFLSERFADKLLAIYQQLPQDAYEFTTESIARRALRQRMLDWLNVNGKFADLALAQYQAADNYTDKLGALVATLGHGHEVPEMTQDFLANFGQRELCMDNYNHLVVYNCKDLNEFKAALDTVEFTNPNRVSPFLRGLQALPHVVFAADKSGVQFITSLIEKADAFNPHLSAGLLNSSFTGFYRYAPQYQAMILEQLEALHANAANLSPNVNEIVESCLRLAAGQK